MQASTADLLAYHAAARPQAVALELDGVATTYGALIASVNRATRMLQSFDLPHGAIVTVEHPDFTVHLPLLLACERLGLASASLAPTEPPPTALLAMTALVLHNAPLTAPARCRTGLLDAAFLEQLRAQPAEPLPLPPVGLHEPQRVRRTSGTTGTPKLMMATVANHEADLRCNLYLNDFMSGSRLLLFNVPWIGAMYQAVTATLRLGGTVIRDTRLHPVDQLRRYRPTHLRALVGELAALLDSMPADAPRLPELTVLTGGGVLTPNLRRRLSQRLTDRILITYSSNEAFRIAAVGPDDIATAVPGVRFEIVGATGRPVALGEEGRVKARTPAKVAGYLGDEAATAERFPDGWFLSSDLARQVGPRSFRLVGREDDIINLGTGKLQPADVEAMVRAAVSAHEVGITAITNADGIDKVCVALVLDPGQDRQQVMATLARSLPANLGQVFLAVVAGLPRTESGKIRTEALKAMFISHVQTAPTRKT